MMKNCLRKLIPSFVLRRYYAWRRRSLIKYHFLYDIDRYADFSSRLDIGEGNLALIVMAAHGVEKGLTMPSFRFCFGQERMESLLTRVNEYLARFGTEDDQIFDVLTIIFEYRKCHVDNGHWEEIPATLRGRIDDLLARFPQIKTDKIQEASSPGEYFSKINEPFFEFVRSRHSVRDFSKEPVNIEDMRQAVDLARFSPSACNRQPARVFILQDKAMIAKVFELQGGNKGFGHTVDKLIIMTGCISGYSGGIERNWVYVDVGLFTMNLVNALHAKKIGTCILNWNMDPQKDRKLRSIVRIPDQDTIVLFVACGKVPETFKFCRSRRKPVDKYLTIV